MFRFFAAWCVYFLIGCAPTAQVANDPEKTNEVLISFISKAQGGFWDEALEFISYEERMQMMDRDQIKPEYESAINRIRLSAITKMQVSLDGKGRLVGIKEVLDASNRRYTVSDQQRNVNLSEVEKARSDRIDKMREEGQRILDEQSNAPQQAEDEILTNRLSDDERQKALGGGQGDDEGSWQEGTSAPEASTPSDGQSDTSGGGWR